jgi:GTP-binding protein
MSKQEQAKVGSFIEEYLQNSKKIALIVFVIDIRHEPTANDKLMYDYIFKTNLPCLVLANKADKIAITKVDNMVENLQEILNPLKDMIFLPFSSERKVYTEKVWEELQMYL